MVASNVLLNFSVVTMSYFSVLYTCKLHGLGLGMSLIARVYLDILCTRMVANAKK